MDNQPLREFAAAAFAEAFGPPESLGTVDGLLYRWVLKCGDGRIVRITLDSPEFPDLAHFLISDTKAMARLTAETARTREDVLALRERLKDCWRDAGKLTAPTPPA